MPVDGDPGVLEFFQHRQLRANRLALTAVLGLPGQADEALAAQHAADVEVGRVPVAERAELSPAVRRDAPDAVPEIRVDPERVARRQAVRQRQENTAQILRR